MFVGVERFRTCKLSVFNVIAVLIRFAVATGNTVWVFKITFAPTHEVASVVFLSAAKAALEICIGLRKGDDQAEM